MGMINQGPYFSGGTPETSVDTTAYAPGLLGMEVRLNVGTVSAPLYRKYKYVKASGTVGAYTVVEYTAAGIGNTVQTGTVAATTASFFAGVCAYTGGNVTDGQYFWIVIPEPGSTVVAAHNVATNATQSDTGLFWAVSSGSFGTVTTAASTSQFKVVLPVVLNISSINSTSATALTSTATTCAFLWLPN